MKSYMSVLVLAVFASFGFADRQTKVSLPGTLHCDSVLSVYGKSGEFHRQAFATLTGITESKAHWSEGDNTTEGVIEQNDENDKIILDFGVGAVGGDQYSQFTFRKDDVEAFNQGKLTTLSGLYEDGYDWADGYHTSSLLVIYCK